MSVVIQAENIFKRYKLGVVSSRTLVQDFNRLLAKVKGTEDPGIKIGKESWETSKNGSYIWALKNINFEVKSGTILGIIGKNGAGKSTLLKILSRVTAPTKGKIKLRGRVASLLEVGTGFHQELTGRENIFLNGSMLGMTKKEIEKKFDEIVEFAGIEKYIDTPVKRYSSGMYVRLGFAVAAHLEPEILIVDEVLAVGDAEFQKRCIGKMKQVSEKEGRTVLFVSHNMGAIKNMCTSCMLMEKGMIKKTGSSEEIISEYLNSNGKRGSNAEFEDKDTEICFKKICIKQDSSLKSVSEIDVLKPFTISFACKINNPVRGASIGFSIYSDDGIKILYSSAPLIEEKKKYIEEIEVEIPGEFLAPGEYYINASIQIENIQLIDFQENAIQFTVAETGSGLNRFIGKDIGLVLAKLNWKKNTSAQTI